MSKLTSAAYTENSEYFLLNIFVGLPVPELEELLMTFSILLNTFG
jgi:hypothetical protein